LVYFLENGRQFFSRKLSQIPSHILCGFTGDNRDFFEKNLKFINTLLNGALASNKV
jgi:hypothetical protein